MLPIAQRLIAGQQTLIVGDALASIGIVFLHGYSMQSSHLAPFAQSLGLPAQYWFPDAPLPSPDGGHTWWHVDPVERAAALAHGARDLRDVCPVDRAVARLQLHRFLHDIASSLRGRPLILAGFSQGAMLILDYLLCHDDASKAVPVDAVALLSTSLIAWQQWQPHLGKLVGLPALVSHGRDDQNLMLSAGESVRDALITGGAHVQWVAFDGGHTIPLLVWRQLRKFIAAQIALHSR